MTDQVGKIEQLIQPDPNNAAPIPQDVIEWLYHLEFHLTEHDLVHAGKALRAAYPAVRDYFVRVRTTLMQVRNTERRLNQHVMTQNTRIRELENEKIALLDQLAEQGMEIKRLQESVREARREVFARIREKGYVAVPREPTPETLKAMEWQIGGTPERPVKTWGTTTAIYQAATAIDQDAIEREVMG